MQIVSTPWRVKATIRIAGLAVALWVTAAAMGWVGLFSSAAASSRGVSVAAGALAALLAASGVLVWTRGLPIGAGFMPAKAAINLGLVVLGLVAAFGVAEVATRVVIANRQWDIRALQPSFLWTLAPDTDRRRFTEHPFLPFLPRPGDGRQTWSLVPEGGDSSTYVVNTRGFRTPDRPLAAPPGTVRIVTLGGSTTWGGATNELTWPALLETKLNATYGANGTRVEVINLAAEAYSSPMSLIVLALLGVEYGPKLVISYDGVNDQLFSMRHGVEPDYRNVLHRYDEQVVTLQALLPSWAFQSYFVSVATSLLDQRGGSFGGRGTVFGQVLDAGVLTLPKDDHLAGVSLFQRNLRSMRAVSEAHHARFIAATAHWKTPNPASSRQNELLREFFAREQMAFLDLDILLPHDDASIHYDDVHWTVKGNDLVAEAWLQRIVADNLLGLER